MSLGFMQLRDQVGAVIVVALFRGRVIGRRSPDASGPTLMPLSASGPQNDLLRRAGY